MIGCVGTVADHKKKKEKKNRKILIKSYFKNLLWPNKNKAQTGPSTKQNKSQILKKINCQGLLYYSRELHEVS